MTSGASPNTRGRVNALFVVDACQSIPHMPVNVADLGADLVAWSGHKMLGPNGIGCLWGALKCLRRCRPSLAVVP